MGVRVYKRRGQITNFQSFSVKKKQFWPKTFGRLSLFASCLGLCKKWTVILPGLVIRAFEVLSGRLKGVNVTKWCQEIQKTRNHPYWNKRRLRRHFHFAPSARKLNTWFSERIVFLSRKMSNEIWTKEVNHVVLEASEFQCKENQ